VGAGDERGGAGTGRDGDGTGGTGTGRDGDGTEGTSRAQGNRTDQGGNGTLKGYWKLDPARVPGNGAGDRTLVNGASDQTLGAGTGNGIPGAGVGGGREAAAGTARPCGTEAAAGTAVGRHGGKTNDG